MKNRIINNRPGSYIVVKKTEETVCCIMKNIENEDFKIIKNIEFKM